jgi:PAS domain S-box-containing protein/putative nucleotidyltransferase with HDIG domain
MKDQSKTKQSLIRELASLREKLSELEKSEAARKRVEETLQESEEKFRVLADSTPTAVMLYQDDRWMYANRAAEIICGYSEKELLAMNFWDIVHPDFKLLIQERGGMRQQGKETITRYEFKIIAKDGSEKWVDLSGASTMLHGRPAGIITVLDINDRKRAEDELRESEEKYRLIFEYSPLGLLSFDEKGIIVACNNNFVKIIGSSREKLIGLNMLKLPDKKMVSTIQKALNGSPGLYEGYYSSVTAKKITPVRCLFAPMDVGDGSILGGVGIIEDITERKQVEEALRKSEELYRTIFENTGTSMIVIEEDMTISMANGEFVRNTGYSLDEINGRMKWTEIVHPNDLGRMVEQHRLRRESQGGALPSYEFRYITKTGHLMDTFLTIKLVPGTKKSIASLIDITDRKQAEEKLQQTLESLKKAVGTTIQVLVSALEARDPYTAGHQSRSANLACAIAKEMGLSQDKIDGIRMAGIIHDIGKLSIPAEILSKPTELIDIEFSLIKEHSLTGYEMLKNVESPWPLAEIIYQHHERVDGSGYPRNLKGDEILMESRILAVADVIEAMASHRPYRPSFGIEAALKEISKNKGILYDHAVVDACLRLFREKGYQLT